jgi:proline iminopeptidase
MKLTIGLMIMIPFLAGFCIKMPKTTAHDATLEKTVIQGYGFHTKTFGNTNLPPLVVVHGGPGGDFHYLLSLAALSDQYRILFYDQRSSGLSPREKEVSGEVESFLKDLEDLVLLHGRGKPVRLIGHSWGAMLAVAFAGRRPDLVSHLVAAEPGILNPEMAKIFVEKQKNGQSIFSMLKMIPYFVGSLFVKTVDGEERFDYVMTAILNASGGPPAQCENSSLPDGSFLRAGYRVFDESIMKMMKDPSNFRWDLTQGIQNYRGKLLLLSSACSHLGYEYQERHHRPLLPASTQHLRLEKTGHDMFTTDPAQAIPPVREFLQ